MSIVFKEKNEQLVDVIIIIQSIIYFMWMRFFIIQFWLKSSLLSPNLGQIYEVYAYSCFQAQKKIPPSSLKFIQYGFLTTLNEV